MGDRWIRAMRVRSEQGPAGGGYGGYSVRQVPRMVLSLRLLLSEVLLSQMYSSPRVSRLPVCSGGRRSASNWFSDGFRSLGREREAQRAGGEHGPLRLTVPVTSVCGAALSVTHLFHCASPTTAGTDRAHCGNWLLAYEEGASEGDVQEADEVVEAQAQVRRHCPSW
jgi:hypothetical protein